MPSQITAILVTYNSAAVIREALSSISNSSRIDRIIVVDNASSDETCAIVETTHPNTLLLHNAENIGFGQANNRALALVQTPFALLLNPDARLKPGCMDALLEAAERYPEAAILAPTLVNAMNVPLESYKRNVWAREKTRDTFHLPDGDLCADFLSGAVWLLRMSAFENTGFFDPRFFLYYEDDDLCIQARKNGFSLVLVKDAHAVHHMGGSCGSKNAINHFKQFHQMLSRLLCESKYHSTNSAIHFARKWRTIYIARCVGAAITLQMRRFMLYISRIRAIQHFMRTSSTK